MSLETTNALRILEGTNLSSVEFVQDYVQLRFDGPCLTAITRPRVHVADHSFDWGMAEYRNALCERIGKVVERTSITEKVELTINFEDDSSLSLSLRPEDYRAAEAAIFTYPPHKTYVW
jgi:hypothetical protein